MAKKTRKRTRVMVVDVSCLCQARRGHVLADRASLVLVASRLPGQVRNLPGRAQTAGGFDVVVRDRGGAVTHSD